jgi:hypothetical protein
MKPIRRAIDAAIVAVLIKPLTRHVVASLRRSTVDQARVALSDRAQAMLPAALLESPALLALTARMLPPEPVPVRDRQSLLRGLLLAAVLAAVATGLAVTVAALLRSRRASRGAGVSTPIVAPVVIPVSAPPEEPAAEPAAAAADEDRAEQPENERAEEVGSVSDTSGAA